MQKTPTNARNAKRYGRTNGPTDRRTDITSYRVACTRLKKKKRKEERKIAVSCHTVTVKVILIRSMSLEPTQHLVVWKRGVAKRSVKTIALGLVL